MKKLQFKLGATCRAQEKKSIKIIRFALHSWNRYLLYFSTMQPFLLQKRRLRQYSWRHQRMGNQMQQLIANFTERLHKMVWDTDKMDIGHFIAAYTVVNTSFTKAGQYNLHYFVSTFPQFNRVCTCCCLCFLLCSVIVHLLIHTYTYYISMPCNFLITNGQNACDYVLSNLVGLLIISCIISTHKRCFYWLTLH